MAEQTPRGDNPFVDLFNPPDTREENPFTGLFNPPETPDPAPVNPLQGASVVADPPEVNPFSGTPVVPPEENPFTGLFDPSEAVPEPSEDLTLGQHLAQPFKGFWSAGSNIVQDTVPTLDVQFDANARARALERLEVFSLLDEGATTEEVVERFGDFSLHDQEYQAATPERREEMKKEIKDGIEEYRQDIMRTLPELAERQAARQEKYGPAVGAYEDVEDWGDAWDYISYYIGSGAAQFVPMIGLGMAGTALTGSPIGGGAAILAFTTAMAGQETIASRLEFIQQIHSDLPPEEQADAIAQYLEETNDVTAMVALGSGALDMGGVVGSFLFRQFKRKAREELVKRGMIKTVVPSVLGEAVTGGAQESLQVLGAKMLKEIDADWTSREIINRIINATFQEALGGLGGVAVSETMQKLRPYVSGAEAAQVAADTEKYIAIEAKIRTDSPELSNAQVMDQVTAQMAELAKKGEAHESWLEGSWTTEPVDELTLKDEIPIDPNEEQKLAEDAATRLVEEAEQEAAVDPAEAALEAERQAFINKPPVHETLTNAAIWDEAVARSMYQDEVWNEAMDAPPSFEREETQTVADRLDAMVNEEARLLEETKLEAERQAEVAIAAEKEAWINDQLEVNEEITTREEAEQLWAEIEARGEEQAVTEPTTVEPAVEPTTVEPALTPQRLTPEFVESLNLPLNITRRKWFEKLVNDTDLSTPQGRGTFMLELQNRVVKSKDKKITEPTRDAIKAWLDLARDPNTTIEALVSPLATPTETTATKTGRVARTDPKAYQKEVQKDVRKAKKALSEFETLEKGVEDRREGSAGKHRQLNRLLNNWNLSLASIKAGRKPLLNHAELENAINNLRQTSVNEMYDIINRTDEEGNFLHNRAHDAVITARQALKHATEAELAKAKEAFNRARPAQAQEQETGRDAPDRAFSKFTNATQLIDHIIKTGTPAEKILAQRIKPFMRGVKVVTVDSLSSFNVPMPMEIISVFNNPNTAGAYFENVIYLDNQRGEGGGLTSWTALHEAFHAAVDAKIVMYLENPESVSSTLREAIEQLIGLHHAFQDHLAMQVTTAPGSLHDVIANAELEALTPSLRRFLDMGESGPVADLREFVAYSLTDADLQHYLSILPTPLSYEFKNKYYSPTKSTWLAELYDIFRKMFNVGNGTQEATLLEDLLLVVDVILDTTDIPPPPQAVRPSLAKKKAQTRAQRKINESKTSKQRTKAVGENYANTPSRNGRFIAVLKSKWDSLSVGAIKIIAEKGLYSGQLVEWVGNKLPKLKAIKDATDTAVSQKVQELRTVVDELIAPWTQFANDRKNQKKMGEGLAFAATGKKQHLVERLHDFIHWTTLRDVQVDPSRAPTVAAYIKQDKKLQEIEKKIADPKTSPKSLPALKGQRTKREDVIKEAYKQWNLFPRRAQSIFKAQLKFHKDWLARRKALAKKRVEELGITDAAQKKRLIAEIDKMFAEAEALEVYAPLGRQGKYYLTVMPRKRGKQPRFFMFDNLTQLNLYKNTTLATLLVEDSDGAFGEGVSIEELQDSANPDSYEISQGEGVSKFKEHLQNNPGEVIKKVMKLFPTSPPKGTTQKVLDDLRMEIEDLYLNLLPEGDTRTSFIKRKETMGFSEDALRTFVSSAIATINQTNRLEHAPKLREAVEAARAQLRETVDDSVEKSKLEVFIGELEARGKDEVQINPDSGVMDTLASMVTAFTFWSLLTSIKSGLINPTQLVVFGSTELAQRFGTKATTAMIIKNGQLWNSLGIKEQRTNIDGDIEIVWTMPSMENSPAIQQASNARMRAILERAWKQGDVWNVYGDTMAADVYGQASTPTDNRRGIKAGPRIAMNFTTSFFRNSERLTREVMFMSSFELSFNKNKKAGKTDGEAYEIAVNEAKDLDETMLFDYKRQSKPRWMKRPTFRLMTQFMTYTFQAYYRMAKLFKGILVGLPNKTRIQALQVFFGVQLMTFMFAGTNGLWGRKWVFSLAEVMRGLFKPDEEDEDYREKIREWDTAGSGNPMGKVNLEYWFNAEFLPAYFGENSAIADVMGLSPEAADLLVLAMKKGPISALTGWNWSASLRLDGMGLRERIPDSFLRALQDPDVEPSVINAAFEALIYDWYLGAPGAVLMETGVGAVDLAKGNFVDGIRPFLPALLKGPFKSAEYSQEGILTREDAPAGGFPEATTAQQVLKRYANEIDLSAEYFQLNEKVALAVNFSATEIASMREELYQLQELSYKVSDERAQVTDTYWDLYQELTKLNYEDDAERMEEVIAEQNRILKNYDSRYGHVYPLTHEQVIASVTSRAARLGQITPDPYAGWDADRIAEVWKEKMEDNPFAGLFETGNN